MLKGKAIPIEAYEVAAWIGGQLRPSGVPGLSSPMVGRDAELSRLSYALRAVRAGRGRVAASLGSRGSVSPDWPRSCVVTLLIHRCRG